MAHSLKLVIQVSISFEDPHFPIAIDQRYSACAEVNYRYLVFIPPGHIRIAHDAYKEWCISLMVLVERVTKLDYAPRSDCAKRLWYASLIRKCDVHVILRYVYAVVLWL